MPKYSPTIQTLVDKGLFDRLPATFSIYSLDRIKDWDRLFPAEQLYFERLFGMLDRSEVQAVTELFDPLRAVERKMDISDGIWQTRKFTLEHVDFLQRNPHLAEWRQAIAGIFARINPILDAEVARTGNPRLVAVVSPAAMPMGPDRMWTRIREHGRLIELVQDSEAPLSDYLANLVSGGPRGRRALSLFDLYARQRSSSPYDTWVIESGDPLLRLAQTFDGWTGLSYERLSDLRQMLMREVNNMVTRENIEGPRELGERLKKMNPRALRRAAGRDLVLQDFLQSVLLNGNGTLLINNTFVEWASLQAIRRAKPSVLLASFGIRNKVKPFSSLLIYTDQEETTPIPTQADMLGSYVDLEVFYQYIWQECNKHAEYRKNTAFLFIGEGMDALFLIAPPDFPLAVSDTASRPGEIFLACTQWLNLEVQDQG